MFAIASRSWEMGLCLGPWYNFNYFLHVRATFINGLRQLSSAQHSSAQLVFPARFLMEVNHSWTQKKKCIKIYCIWQVFVNDYGTCSGSRFGQGLATPFSDFNLQSPPRPKCPLRKALRYFIVFFFWGDVCWDGDWGCLYLIHLIFNIPGHVCPWPMKSRSVNKLI